MKKNKIYLAFLFVASCFFTSCLSTKVDIGKKTDLYAVEFVHPKEQKYKLRFYGILKDNKLDVTNVYWFDNWENGWTEVRFMATGILKITHESEKEDSYVVESPVVLEAPEIVKIRLKDTYLSGSEGISALQNRLSRIESINEVINSTGNRYSYVSLSTECSQMFFPEKFRKSDTYKTLNKESETILGDGTKWNVEYTKAVFPEYMWEARNTGTLYRDWEEAFDLIYILYDWDSFFGEDKKGDFTVIETKLPEEKEMEEK